MQDLMPPVNTPDNAFHDGDPTTGKLGTIVSAQWLNNNQAAIRDIQQECKNILAKAGITPDPRKQSQLADAITAIVAKGWLEKAKNGADIPNKSKFVKNLGFIEQATGASTTTVMSQRAVTDIVASNASIGVNQQWRDVTAQRVGGVAYVNDTGRPIAVFARTKTKLAEEPEALGIGGIVNGVLVAFSGSDYAKLKISLGINFIVPVGANYVVNAQLGHANNFVELWTELR
ncbi:MULTISPECIES: hypothetical protein [Xenorhabdus]|uniref:hypothetical protein n=1 Tax=Xenorhabdus TaxID=626 RepID=UPI00069B358F|nr:MULTISPECIES: hypothetical protein [Xenorhabdus]